MGGVDGEGHVLLRLVAGVAEHHALVARALLLEQPLARGHALGDVWRLLLHRDDHRAAVAVEARFWARVADVADHALRDLAELHLALLVISPATTTRPVLMSASQAMRLSGSWARSASTMPSEI